MICQKKYCGGKLKTYSTHQVKIQNIKHSYARCLKCGARYLLETRIKKKLANNSKTAPSNPLKTKP